jgi:hypothetical protein
VAGLTAADRKWMDEIVKDVNEGWDDVEKGVRNLQFKGSDDYLRVKVLSANVVLDAKTN